MNYKRYFIPNSMVFLTIVTYNRNPVLLEQINLIKDSLKYTKTKIQFDIVAIVNRSGFNPTKTYCIIYI